MGIGLDIGEKCENEIVGVDGRKARGSVGEDWDGVWLRGRGEMGVGWSLGTGTKGLRAVGRKFRCTLELNIPISLCLYILGVDYK